MFYKSNIRAEITGTLEKFRIASEDGNYEDKLPVCPVEVTLALISNKWKILIIRDLLEGTKRFGELKIKNRREF